jgi:hypothetical protein
MRKRLIIAAALAIAGSVPTLAQAEGLGDLLSPESFANVVDELRFGAEFHRVYPTVFLVDPSQLNFDRLEDVTFDVLFRSPIPEAFWWTGRPRPDLGATINLKGYESFVHFGLTWQAHIFDTPIFVEGTLGGALNNGYATNPPPGYYAQGCPWGFYERVGVGVDLPSNMTVLVNYEHSSNWGVCGTNQGMTMGGVKLGFKF